MRIINKEVVTLISSAVIVNMEGVIITSSTAPKKTVLLPLPAATSVVWKYFGFPAIDGKFSECLNGYLFSPL